MKIPATLLFLLVHISLFAQLKSPEAFLGYKPGSRYTPHFNIVNYCRHVAEAVPSMVKLEQYGVTHEGRPLLLLYISAAGNLGRLEEIRQNNLRLAGVLPGNAAAVSNAPAIIWLSYNVHGNETSSSEAAMMTLYELVNPSNSRTKEWLKNSVVIMDPCINPDGRDRYVNWFNSVVGKNANPVHFTREHSEPWPGGRSNHYYFDLNRDWAWQTQIETRQRIVKYNQWLPHIHVDYHEQYYNNPYYFAPAAEPYHEVITPWQREFQVTIGKNNAKYFDRNGWLFFTKEQFDLFYPSYGDTYPLYKGAIGMTYEQGGHSRGGAAVIDDAGDTLTLWDRLYHHFTTGLATIEVTAQNAARVVQEFKKYYDKARTDPMGEFRAYVVKADEGDKLKRLKELLDRNNIEWFDANNGSYTGLNYFTSRTETFKSTNRDIIINANQPHSNLLKVLFERHSKLSDSVTYDITAWSIPFCYGLTTYGLSNYVTGLPKTKSVATVNTGNLSGENAAAWLVRWNGSGSMRFLSQVLQKGLKVRFAEQRFESGGRQYDRGTLIVTRAGNKGTGESLRTVVETAAKEAEVVCEPVTSTFVEKGTDFGSDRVLIIQRPKVALLAGDGVSSLGMGEIWHFFDEIIHYPVNVVWVNDLNSTVLNEVNTLILPDGNYRFLNDKTMNERLKEWVRSGGRIIALENAVAQMARAEWGIRLKDDNEKKEDKEENNAADYSLLKKYENRERDHLVNYSPGAIFKVELDLSHPLAFGYDDAYYTLKQDSRIYDFFADNGWNVGVVKKDNQVAGFVGSGLKEKLRDGLLFGVQPLGRGSVVYLADNPLFRSFWENGKLLFGNAVFLAGQ